MKIIEAYRFGEAEPPIYRALCGSGTKAHWHEVHGLGEQELCDGVVTLVEASSPWNQSMRSGPAVLPDELRRIRGGR
jgi:hypothetical protein